MIHLAQGLHQVHAGGTTEHHQIQQGVAAEAVGTVYRDAGYLPHREQADHGDVVAVFILGQALAVHAGRHAAHHVVAGRDDGNGFLDRIHVGEGARELADARQTGFQYLFAEVIQLELDVRAPGTVTATAFADLDHDGASHHVATGQVLGVGRITLHEALAIFVEQIAAFTTATLGHQYPCPGDAGGVELPELHVLHADPGTQCHADAVTRVDVGVGGGLVDATGAAGGEHRGLGLEVDDFAALHVDGGTADDVAVLVLHQIQGIPLGEDGGLVLDVLLIQGMQQGVTCPVGSRRGTGRLLAAKILGLTAEGALIDRAVVEAGEGQAHVLQLIDGLGARLAHVFNRFLVTDVIGALDGVIHVPLPVVVMGIAQGDRDPALGGNRVGTSRENLGKQCAALAGLGNLQRGAHAGTTGTDHDRIKFTSWNSHLTHPTARRNPSSDRRTAPPPAQTAAHRAARPA